MNCPVKKADEIPIAQLCQLLTEFVSAKTIDLGSTILHVGEHVHLGELILISTDAGRAACITL